MILYYASVDIILYICMEYNYRCIRIMVYRHYLGELTLNGSKIDEISVSVFRRTTAPHASRPIIADRSGIQLMIDVLNQPTGLELTEWLDKENIPTRSNQYLPPCCTAISMQGHRTKGTKNSICVPSTTERHAPKGFQ